MTDEQLSASLRAFTRRTPFRSFFIEFFSGHQIPVSHQEGVAPFGDVWLFHDPRGNSVVFASSSVCRLLDQDLP